MLAWASENAVVSHHAVIFLHTACLLCMQSCGLMHKV